MCTLLLHNPSSSRNLASTISPPLQILSRYNLKPALQKSHIFSYRLFKFKIYVVTLFVPFAALLPSQPLLLFGHR